MKQKSRNSKTSKGVGLEELASWRAELFLLARKVLENSVADNSWLPNLNSLGSLYRGTFVREQGFENVSLDGGDDSTGSLAPDEDIRPSFIALDPEQLRKATMNQQYFINLYDLLTKKACGLFFTARKTKSLQKVMIDRALLLYHCDNYEAAVPLLESVLDNFAPTGHWPFLHGLLLEIHAECLKHLGLMSAYTHALIKVLRVYAIDRAGMFRVEESDEIAGSLLNDLFLTSRRLEQKVSVPMTDFFHVTNHESFIQHFEDRDGFYITLQIEAY